MAGANQTEALTIAALDAYGLPQAGHGHVFNLGHGISQFTAPENVSALLETVHRYSREQRQRAAQLGGR